MTRKFWWREIDWKTDFWPSQLLPGVNTAPAHSHTAPAHPHYCPCPPAATTDWPCIRPCFFHSRGFAKFCELSRCNNKKEGNRLRKSEDPVNNRAYKNKSAPTHVETIYMYIGCCVHWYVSRLGWRRLAGKVPLSGGGGGGGNGDGRGNVKEKMFFFYFLYFVFLAFFHFLKNKAGYTATQSWTVGQKQ